MASLGEPFVGRKVPVMVVPLTIVPVTVVPLMNGVGFCSGTLQGMPV